MAKKKRERRERRDSNKRVRKKVSLLDQESIEWVDYKDVDLLKRFMSDRAKIRARRVTGNNTQQQRAVAKAIKLARELALLPYTERVATTARGKRRRRDEERDDGDERMEPRRRPDQSRPRGGDADIEREGGQEAVDEEAVDESEGHEEAVHTSSAASEPADAGEGAGETSAAGEIGEEE